MEPTPNPAPAPVTPAPVTPAPVTPAPVTPVPVTPAPPANEYAAGGFLKKMDWVEIGFLALGAFTLFHVIYYYRKKTKAENQTQEAIKELINKTESLDRKMAAIGRQTAMRR